MSRSLPPRPDPGAALTFNVSTLLQEPIGSRRHYTLNDAPFDYDAFATALDGRLDFLRTDGSILVTATLTLKINETCVVCLQPFLLPLKLRLEEEFWPPTDPITHEPLQIPEEREGFPVVEGLLDLREAVRQYIEMARPMSPHCGSTCPGQGAAPNGRSSANASAPQPTVDSRWSALQSLRDRLE